MQINGKANGPFDVIPHREASAYPMLWRHSAARERRLIVEPDREGRVRPNRDQKALDVWNAAGRLHFNRDFRLNSQSLAACLTPERSIGGRALAKLSTSGHCGRRGDRTLGQHHPGLGQLLVDGRPPASWAGLS